MWFLILSYVLPTTCWNQFPSCQSGEAIRLNSAQWNMAGALYWISSTSTTFFLFSSFFCYLYAKDPVYKYKSEAEGITEPLFGEGVCQKMITWRCPTLIQLLFDCSRSKKETFTLLRHSDFMSINCLAQKDCELILGFGRVWVIENLS